MPAEALGKIAEILDVSADWLISGKPARLDPHCAGMALLRLEEMRSGAQRVGHEIAVLTAGQLFVASYTPEYMEVRNSGYSQDLADITGGRGNGKASQIAQSIPQHTRTPLSAPY